MDWKFMLIYVFTNTAPKLMLLLWALRFKRRFSGALTAIIITATMLVVNIISGVFIRRPDLIGGWGLFWSFTAMLIGVGAYLLMCKENVWKVTFSYFVVKSYTDCVNHIAISGYENCFQKEVGQMITKEIVVGFAVITVLTLPLMWMLFRKMMFPLMYSPSCTRLWKYLWIYPIMFYLLNRLLVSDRYIGSITMRYNALVPLLWTITTFASYFVVLQVLAETDKSYSLQEKLKISDIQAEMQRQQYAGVSEAISQTMEARHDLRHHVLAMQGYLDSEDIQGLRQYLNSIAQVTEKGSAVLCENSAANMILWHYIELARSKDIEINVTVKLPVQLPIDESDFCIVLSNLLENAVAAAVAQQEGPRFISGKVGMTGEGKLAVMLKNSYSGEITQDGESFVSVKHAGDGIGTASVRRVAQKYGGITRFTYENNVFEASVLLSS